MYIYHVVCNGFSEDIEADAEFDEYGGILRLYRNGSAAAIYTHFDYMLRTPKPPVVIRADPKSVIVMDAA